jgi:class 3 adenylate cyclase/tetratricopeptide (TPR) repeat protein
MAESRRERKVVTVLFADLVGFTARAEELDPEDVEAILRPYHERLRSELERFGGTVEKFIGDAVMALFGAPVAHEDDPERAVRAALAIRDWAREDGDVQVRIAVNTGEALINLDARPESGEAMAAGDVVNTTARLQSAAPVNGILVGETTYRATRGLIDYEVADSVEAKGKAEPIPVWRAREARGRVRTEPISTAAPVVGRDREVALLRDTLVRARDELAPQLVTIVGVPGIGKTRLVRELFQFVEQGGILTFWRQGRSLPYGEGVTFWALSEIVKAQAGILETDDDEEVEAKLRSALTSLVAHEEERTRLVQYLHPLVGLGGELGHASQAEAFAAWRQFFEAMAEQHPLILVFEDMQWADEGLLDFVDHLVDWAPRLPILVVCTARPELLERRPGWGGGKLNATTLSLSPLSDEDTARLLSALLVSPVLESQRQRALLTRAGGNPLYAEQFVQMLSDRGASTEDHVPETVQGIIAARLDRLPALEKELLQDAAVLGKIFWLGGLVDGRGRIDVEHLLHSLERKGFVQRSRRSSVSDEPEYEFLHVLVRDVAYGQIPRADRAAKHRRVAEWIESLGRTEDHAEMLAHHYGSALELSRAAGAEMRDVVPHARTHFQAAGHRAASLNAYSAAARFYEQALALCPEDQVEARAELLLALGRALSGAGDERLHEVLEAARGAFLEIGDQDRAAETDAIQALAWWYRADLEHANDYLQRAEWLIRDRPPSASKARILSEIARFHMVGARHEEATVVGNEALAIVDELGLEDVRAGLFVTLGSSRMFLGDPSGSRAIAEEALALADRLNLPEVSWRAINNLSITVLIGEGDVERAARLGEDGLRRAERLGVSAQIAWFHGFLTLARFWLGDFDDALRFAELALSADQHHYRTTDSYRARAKIRLARDDDAGAASDVERAIEFAEQIGERQVISPAYGEGAFVLSALGRRREASVLVDQAVEVLEPHTTSGNTDPQFVPFAFAAVDLGRAADFLEATANISFSSPWLVAARAYAGGDLEEAVGLVSRLSVPDEALVRLRIAQDLIAEGRRAEADRELAQALAFWRSVGAKRYIREGEALLAATA